MKKLFCRVLALALCAVMLTLPAAAAADDLLISPAPAPAAQLSPVRVWGRATRLEGGSLFLQNSDADDPNREIIVHLSETTPVVDAVTGLPLDAAEIKDGDTVYAWVGPAMTMSLPPQSTASVVVANIPADGEVPQYYEISGPDQTVTIAIYPAPPRTEVNLPTAGGEVLRIPVTAKISPWLTKNIVTLDDLTPGTRVLVWRDSAKTVNRVLVLGNDYRGYLSWYPGGAVFVNGEALSVVGKAVDGEVLLPIRAVAEAAGYTVAWEPGKGAVVTDSGAEVFAVLPGASLVQTADGGQGLSAPCVFEAGATYLPAADLAFLLNLYPSL